MFGFFKPKVATEPLSEYSTNFDSEHVGPCLQRLSPLIDSGFSEIQISEITQCIKEMSVDDEQEFAFPIIFKGKDSALKIKVFLDDIDAPDLYFFAIQELTDLISKEATVYLEQNGF